jgi:hypothetical protein
MRSRIARASLGSFSFPTGAATAATATAATTAMAMATDAADDHVIVCDAAEYKRLIERDTVGKEREDALRAALDEVANELQTKHDIETARLTRELAEEKATAEKLTAKWSLMVMQLKQASESMSESLVRECQKNDEADDRLAEVMTRDGAVNEALRSRITIAEQELARVKLEHLGVVKQKDEQLARLRLMVREVAEEEALRSRIAVAEQELVRVKLEHLGLVTQKDEELARLRLMVREVAEEEAQRSRLKDVKLEQQSQQLKELKEELQKLQKLEEARKPCDAADPPASAAPAAHAVVQPIVDDLTHVMRSIERTARSLECLCFGNCPMCWYPASRWYMSNYSGGIKFGCFLDDAANQMHQCAERLKRMSNGACSSCRGPARPFWTSERATSAINMLIESLQGQSNRLSAFDRQWDRYYDMRPVTALRDTVKDIKTAITQLLDFDASPPTPATTTVAVAVEVAVAQAEPALGAEVAQCQQPTATGAELTPSLTRALVQSAAEVPVTATPTDAEQAQTPEGPTYSFAACDFLANPLKMVVRPPTAAQPTQLSQPSQTTATESSGMARVRELLGSYGADQNCLDHMQA